MGGTALAQCWKQIGNEAPDLDEPDALLSAFQVTQKLIKGNNFAMFNKCKDGFWYTSSVTGLIASFQQPVIP